MLRTVYVWCSGFAAAFAAFPQAQIVDENGVSTGHDRNWSKRA